MPKKIHIKVVKVPLTREEKFTARPKAFPRMPRLYLELLENKTKIKQDLINREHVSNLKHGEIPKNTPTPPKKYHSSREPGTPDSIISIESTGSIDEDRTPEKSKHSSDEEINENQSEYDSEIDRETKQDNYSDDGNESVYSNDGNDSVVSKHSEISDRLKELLADDNDDNSSVDSFQGMKRSLDRSKSRSDKYSRHHSNPMNDRSIQRSANYNSIHGNPEPIGGYEEKHNGDHNAPTLAELEARGQYNGRDHLRDINQINIAEQDLEDRKRELMFKFQILKKSYPNSVIPEFSIHSDYNEMHRSYDHTLRKLSLDSTVDNYKTYLIGGFMVVEFVLGKFLKLDMQGFTQQQIVSMHSYEKLLIELGEKSYVPGGSKWPVELRLLGLITMNAAFFVVSKIIMRKTGANLMGMINGMNVAQNTPVPPSASGKRRMRGPDINLDDLP